jgi:putative endonuclease
MIAWVYIVTNKPHGVVYVGVTSDLKGRIAKHKAKHYPRNVKVPNCSIFMCSG